MKRPMKQFSSLSIVAVISLFCVPPAAVGETVSYVVRPGDTISAIAARNKTTIRAILLENDIADANRIYVGQTIRLSAASAPQSAPQPAAVPEPQTAESVALSAKPASVAGEMPVRRPVERTAPVLRKASFFDVWIRERLSVGLSVSFSRLTDADRPEDESRTRTFVGYVNHLSLENEFGFVPTLNWLASDFVRVGLTLHETEARTRNFKKDPHLDRRLSDGNATASGVLLSVEGTWPFYEGRLRPHAGLGLGWYKGSFDEDTWWRLGYLSPVDWNAAGRPSSGTLEGRYRAIHIDDEVGLSAAVGIAWRPAQNWELDFSLRRTWLDPDCEFGYVDEKSGRWTKSLSGHFTMDSLAAVLTASWVF